MFESLTRIYKRKKDAKLLDNAVKKGWITADEKAEIIAAAA